MNTKKQILAAVYKEYQVVADDGSPLWLHKGNGYYWFYCNGPSILDYTDLLSVYVNSLSQISISDWVDSFGNILETTER